ncbi:helix-turn-helix domain-containing protein [Thaumasiovibrio sp. DFM-14]|uniref:AraC family transcriptional regulator n=1 Tax=Thaumasiovibrio sp. DFM-14 TaxID=3384792 RepID=UPI0039A17EF7
MTKGHRRQIPSLEALPHPIYARPESWGREGSTTEWHCHCWGQLTYASQGVLSVSTNDGYYTAPPQFAIWVPSHTQHKVISTGAATMQSLYVDNRLLREEKWAFPFVCKVTPLCRELIVRFCQSDPDYTQSEQQSRLVQVLIDELNQLKENHSKLMMPKDTRLVTLCRYLQAHPDSQLSIEALGEKINLTGRSISRHFRAETGITFQQWRQRLRLYHALSLLESGDSVTNVALECGYDSISAFVAAFKKHFGITPGQFFPSDPKSPL